MIVSTTPSAARWIGMIRINTGITTAPVRVSHGWKLIAAQAVGG